MDLPASNSSPVQPPSTAHVQPKAGEGWIFSTLRRIGILVLIGILFGGVIAGLAMWFPYNRIVVYDQPMSPNIKVRSVRMAQGGFIVIFLNEGAGWQMVGNTSYLPPGYYRNIVVLIDRAPKEEQDVPVKGFLGHSYAKHFWFIRLGVSPARQLRLSLLDRPVTLLFDLLFP
ncbi:hypothetical protein HY031_01875 [Candidatus Gottesmanbacteria bacterium]|nr:hypothetical protein [Candidatus Gottesmanbacteria bacterium]